MGEEGRPGKKLKKPVKVKKAERPPANPVVDVGISKIPNQKKRKQTLLPFTTLVKQILPHSFFCNRLL